jgi:hypothetical protein
MQIQDCGLRYQNVMNTPGKGKSIQAVSVGNSWFDLSKAFWRLSNMNDVLVKREYEEIIAIFSKQGQMRFADRVLSGVDGGSVFQPSMPFGNLYMLIEGGTDEEVRVLGKIRLNCSMLPGIEIDMKERRYKIDAGTWIISFTHGKVGGCVGSLLYQLLPVLFMAQLANQCMIYVFNGLVFSRSEWMDNKNMRIVSFSLDKLVIAVGDDELALAYESDIVEPDGDTPRVAGRFTAVYECKRICNGIADGFYEQVAGMLAGRLNQELDIVSALTVSLKWLILDYVSGQSTRYVCRSVGREDWKGYLSCSNITCALSHTCVRLCA